MEQETYEFVGELDAVSPGFFVRLFRMTNVRYLHAHRTARIEPGDDGAVSGWLSAIGLSGLALTRRLAGLDDLPQDPGEEGLLLGLLRQHPDLRARLVADVAQVALDAAAALRSSPERDPVPLPTEGGPTRRRRRRRRRR
ncbi:MAG: hypothetical protein OHK0013_32100 [Sandaracinaceae bacterium]